VPLWLINGSKDRFFAVNRVESQASARKIRQRAEKDLKPMNDLTVFEVKPIRKKAFSPFFQSFLVFGPDNENLCYDLWY